MRRLVGLLVILIASAATVGGIIGISGRPIYTAPTSNAQDLPTTSNVESLDGYIARMSKTPASAPDSPSDTTPSVRPEPLTGIDAALSEAPTGSTPMPSPDDQGYRDYCTEEATKRGAIDEQMRDYCVVRQQDGYAKLKEEMNKFGGYSWMAGDLDWAISNWTKRGARRDEMVDFVIHEQTEAFLDLKYMASHEKPEFNRDVANSCFSTYEHAYGRFLRWDVIEWCYKDKLGLN